MLLAIPILAGTIIFLVMLFLGIQSKSGLNSLLYPFVGFIVLILSLVIGLATQATKELVVQKFKMGKLSYIIIIVIICVFLYFYGPEIIKILNTKPHKL